MPSTLDHVDLTIIHRLEEDGRLTPDDLAAQAGVSPKEAAARILKLEHAGHIDGYSIIRGYPDPKSRPYSGVIRIWLDPARDGWDFWRGLESIPEIVTAEVLNDDSAVLLRLLANTEDRAQEIAKALSRQSIVRSVQASGSVPVITRRFSSID